MSCTAFCAAKVATRSREKHLQLVGEREEWFHKTSHQGLHRRAVTQILLLAAHRRRCSAAGIL